MSKEGFNNIKYPYAYRIENIYFKLHRKYNTIQENESSTQKDEYQYLYKKDGELKFYNIENEGIVEYGNGFKNCKN